jgi:DNA-binding LytR/AlgR family response regulator
MKFKAVIVDDEQPICDEIEYLLEKQIDIEAVAVFNDGYAALSYILEHNIGLIFLDINLPGMSGLEMAQRLSVLRKPPFIIFITAFQEHALEAFDTPAVGFVTKPVTEVNLTKVLNKVRALTDNVGPQLSAPANKICVINNGKFVPVDKQDIVLVYVKNKDVFLRTASGEFTSTLTLQEVEITLAVNRFLRVHRQYIVNLDKITEIIPWFHGTYLLRMDDCNKEEVPVSRNKVKLLKQIMGLK